ncbi:uncharacterized protein LOC130550544 [Triplophysa rosa]|uniref:uncharacterized protein LOC130550544 n=1 Tax=Triplophysa rosa TaxID=992332 RepID=UPI0025460953|nr:uncharacterized protein LOC130550544 [Triplophysa rosa]
MTRSTVIVEANERPRGGQREASWWPTRGLVVANERPRGATVACLTPDQKVACSNHVGVTGDVITHNTEATTTNKEQLHSRQEVFMANKHAVQPNAKRGKNRLRSHNKTVKTQMCTKTNAEEVEEKDDEQEEDVGFLEEEGNYLGFDNEISDKAQVPLHGICHAVSTVLLYRAPFINKLSPSAKKQKCNNILGQRGRSENVGGAMEARFLKGGRSGVLCGRSQVCTKYPSLSLRRHTHRPLAKHLMHKAHFSGNTSARSKSSSDWLNFTGFPGDMRVAFFNGPPGNNKAF